METRPSRRYVSIRIVAEGAFSQEAFQEGLEREIRRGFGAAGLAKINPRIIRFEPEKKRAVVRCNSRYVPELKFALAITEKIGEQPCVLFSKRTSGTLKSLREDSEHI